VAYTHWKCASLYSRRIFKGDHIKISFSFLLSYPSSCF
jgi:hypothetical protein